jgi:hypothetical protein
LGGRLPPPLAEVFRTRIRLRGSSIERYGKSIVTAERTICRAGAGRIYADPCGVDRTDLYDDDHGMPIGATIGGLLAIPLLEHFGWRSIFVNAGCLSLVSLLSVWRFMIAAPDFVTLAGSRESRRQEQQPHVTRPPGALRALAAGARLILNLNEDLGFLQRTILIAVVSFCIQVSAFLSCNGYRRFSATPGSHQQMPLRFR